MRVGFYLYTNQQPGGASSGQADPQTLLQIAPATDRRITILGADISLQGAAPATTPIEFSWVTQTSAGTSTGTITPQKMDRGYNEGFSGTYPAAPNFLTYNSGTIVEPTLGAVLVSFAIHRQAFVQWRPPYPLIIEAGTPERLGFRYHGVDLATQANNITTSVTVYCEQ